MSFVYSNIILINIFFVCSYWEAVGVQLIMATEKWLSSHSSSTITELFNVKLKNECIEEDLDSIT